ncbi:MAG: hypothetical protein E7614_08710 [Ruminococcaceae bacterium]|nr:hypothetical protein [Oscillospiraceae bacterium]
MGLFHNILRAYLPERFEPYFKIYRNITLAVIVLIIIPSVCWKKDSLGDYELMNGSDISALERSLKYFSPEDISIEDCIYNVSGEEYLSFIKDDVYISIYPVTNGGEFSYEEEYSRSFDNVIDMLVGNIEYMNSVTVKSEYWSITAYEVTEKKHSYVIKDYFYEIFNIPKYA